MSVIEDVRQVFQDFLAPELRAITTRLDAIDQRFVDITTVMNARSNALDQRIADLAAIMNTRFDSVSKEIAQVRELLEIDRRLSRLESKQSQVAQ